MRAKNPTRELYCRAGYRLLAWVERPLNAPLALYVRLERANGPPEFKPLWQHVRTTEASVTPAPWWKPWARKWDLQTVVAREIAFIEQQEDLEASAAATLEAVAEATRLIEA